MTDEDKRHQDDPASDDPVSEDLEETAGLDVDEDQGEEGMADAEAEESLQDELKRVVETRLEDIGTLRKKMTVIVPRETIDGRLDEQYAELRRDAAVPGFRRGRAPRRLLEKRFGSEVGETLVQQLVSGGYMAAVEKQELKIVGDPLVWAREKDAESESLMEVEKAIELIELPDEGDFTFACELEVRPEFDLPELDNIPVEKPVISITDDDVTAQLDRLLSSQGHYEPAGEDAIQPDDLITADVKMSSGGTVLKEQEGATLAARPQQVESVNLEGLGEVLVGHKAGDVVTTSGEIGDDYPKEELRGKQADFEFSIKDIRRFKTPEFNEEFIKTLGFEDEQDLRDYIRQDLESRLDDEVRRGMQSQIYQYLLDNTSFDVPDRVSQRQAGRVLVNRMLEMYQQGIPPQEVEKQLDQLRTSSQQETIRDLKLFFIMESLAEQIEVEVSESELNGVIAAIAQRQGRRFDRVRDDLAKEDRLMSLYLQIRDRKIVDQLLEQAKVTEKQPGEIDNAQAVDESGKGGKRRGPRKAQTGRDAAKKDVASKSEEKNDDNADET